MLLNENDAVSYSLKYDVESVKAFFCGAGGGGWGGGVCASKSDGLAKRSEQN